MNGIFEEARFELEKEFTVRPLEHKGFNKHFVNLISADVFQNKKTNLFSAIIDFFK